MGKITGQLDIIPHHCGMTDKPLTCSQATIVGSTEVVQALSVGNKGKFYRDNVSTPLKGTLHSDATV